MLHALSIRSFVLIDRLDLEASTGFTALTGETGAGKSIILDALGLVLGAAADRKQVRAGADKAIIRAEFSVAHEHPVWALLEAHEIDFDRDETLCLRRNVPSAGPSRAFVNDQPVSAALLATLGEHLVEIHGQHSASQLMRPASHLDLLDAFAGLSEDVRACGALWSAYETRRQARMELEAAVQGAQEKRDWLNYAVADLSALSPEPDEVTRLTDQRSALLQSERISESVDEAAGALAEPRLEECLATASRAAERIIRVPGLESLEGDLSQTATATAEAVERTLIELAEAQALVKDLARHAGHDSRQLESVEARLFALRAAARKYDCLPELLTETLDKLQQDLAHCEGDTASLEEAHAAEQEAQSAWRAAAERISAVRHQRADSLAQAVMKELEPLQLGRVRFRITFRDLDEEESGGKGLERALFEVETNPGAGFGPLKSIASGGELARLSLALKCALSQCGDTGTLIFDEADQGVGGAVAAAIGERLAALAGDRQLFAVTHSPQVASAATRQWRIMKETDENDQTVSRVAQLDDGQRLEEIARMLSGSSITNEARAAALKLLEAA
nr:DNA repair protein RecN [Hyphomonas sp. Mor2]